MSLNGPFELDLRRSLEADAPTAAPLELHEAAMVRARRSRQRPRWLAVVRTTVPGPGTSAWPSGPSILPIIGLVAVTILLLAMLVASLAGGFVKRPISSGPGRNGLIAYDYNDLPEQPYNHAHLIQADGTGDREIAQGTCPRFSADGRTLAYLSGWWDSADLIVAAADGTSPHTVAGVGESDAALSPDGSEVAWFKRLNPITSPDGNSTVGSTDELWVTPVSGGPGRRILPATDAPSVWHAGVGWSPDGRWIAFSTMLSVTSGDNMGSYRTSISAIGADGSDLHLVTGRIGTDFSADFSWSPDGQSIAYVGLRDGSPLPSLGPSTGDIGTFYPPEDLFTVGADGTGEEAITDTLQGESKPRWSPDGAHLAYLTDGTTGQKLATVRMNGRRAGAQPKVGHDEGFDSYDWSPDGTQLLAIKRIGSGRTFTNVTGTMVTFDAELEQAASSLLAADHSIGMCSPSWQWLEP